ncbi:AMP-binding protein [Nonomuraea diastatica]|uniref:Carrier domain-containing protein n=1 Tax=Nonomuraea diastatica TaxID=1848329 RepID=A0A4R4VJI3_9ACTN|nr:AMP-binding protein [Nonomuraea diastatica]TDD05141.1 hypothetical protein E1294_49695 [Nonomuraea diastatica]
MTSPTLPGAVGLLSSIRYVATRTPDRTALIFLADGEQETYRISYSLLVSAVAKTGERLARAHPPGTRALLCFPSGAEFVTAFLACLYAGIVAVPVAPPATREQVVRLGTVVADADTAVVITDASTEPFLDVPRITVPLPAADGRALWTPRLAVEDLAFLQYTSGSTNTPKGVMVTHGALTANLRMITSGLGFGGRTVEISWLPVFHDMGLIGALLAPLAAGSTVVLMPPMAFLRDPLNWLRAASRYRATITGAPNFAYELCHRRLGDRDPATVGIELSAMELMLVGAEPIRPSTVESFRRRFAPAGLRPSTLFPAYGLAEVTLMATGHHLGGEIGLTLDPGELEQGRAVPADTGRTVVNCGPSVDGQTLVVADPATGEPCPPGVVGEIWLAGNHVTRGYWRNPQATADATAHLPTHPGLTFLRTGDLGFQHDGDLYVTGRRKDMIILGGRNHYPQDIESTAETYPDVRPRGAAAFPVEHDGTEGVALAAEVTRAGSRDELACVAMAIADAIWREHDLAVTELVLLKPGTLPRTTSGKLRRRHTGDLLRAGELGEVYRHIPAVPRSRPLPAADPAALTETVLSAPRAAGERAVVYVVRTLTAALLGLDGPDAVPADVSPGSLGLDSIKITELSTHLSAALGVPVPIELIRTTTNPAELGAALYRRLLVHLATSAPHLVPNGTTTEQQGEL